MKPENIDELERQATHNLGELNRVRERGDGDTQLAKVFEKRMNDALEEMKPYFEIASDVVLELTSG